MYLAAAIQLSCTSNEDENLRLTRTLVGRAASYGAQLVCTPECTNYLGPHKEKVRRAEPLSGPTVSRYRDLARKHHLHLMIGSVNEKSDDTQRCYNTSVLIGPEGDILAAYRKIHLFDVDVSAETRFKESDTTLAGDRVVVAETPLGRIGLSICYDLRFPEGYRMMVDQGADLITIPSAFTLTTGKDHWHPLTRARAIETQCYVIAPGQSGEHDDDGLRNSYGHSMIVSPWGHITAISADGPGLALAEIDLDRVRTFRRGLPIRDHRRL